MKSIDTTGKKFKRFKQIAAIVGIVLLVAMYIIALVASLTDSDYAPAVFMTAIYATFVVPVVIYLLQVLYKVVNKE